MPLILITEQEKIKNLPYNFIKVVNFCLREDNRKYRYTSDYHKLRDIRVRLKVPEGGYEPTLDEIKYLSDKLTHLPKTSLLDLSGIKFTSITGNYFTNAFRQFKFKKLQLSIDNENDLNSLVGLSNTNIKFLSLKNSKNININKLIEIVKGSNVTDLSVKNCNIGDEEAILLISELKTVLQNLNLSSNKITSNSVKILSQLLSTVHIKRIYFTSKFSIINKLDDFFSRCFSLNIDNNKLTNEDFVYFIRAVSIYEKNKLEIYNFDARILSLMRNVKVYSLDLKTENKFDLNFQFPECLKDDDLDILIDYLEILELHELILENPQISDEGYEKLFKALPTSKVINLSISGTKNFKAISTIGFNNINNTKITHLNLSRMYFRREEILSINNFIITSNLVELGLYSIKSLDDELLILLFQALKYTQIVKLRLNDNYKIEDRGIYELINMLPDTKLKSIDLIYVTMSDDCLLHLFRTVIQLKICELYTTALHNTHETLKIITKMLENYYLLTDSSEIENFPHILELKKRNKLLTQNAANVIDKHGKKTLEFNHKNREDLLSFQLTADYYFLWTGIVNHENNKRQILNLINENYFQITGIVKDKVESADESKSFNKKGIFDLPKEVIKEICSYLLITDVK